MVGNGRRLELLVPGDPATPTGGYEYDRRIASGLEALGWRVHWHALAGSFPNPAHEDLQAAHIVFESFDHDALVVVDGLAGGVLREQLEAHRNRLRLLALVHHPLGLETGLTESESSTLLQSEARALTNVRGVVVTSRATADTIAAPPFGLPAERIRIVTPGTERAEPATPPSQPPVRLLCVASLTPRKAHDVLIEALGQLSDIDVELRCAGADHLAPDYAARLRASEGVRKLGSAVRWLGVLDSEALDAEYRQAHALVLPSHHEGYGMVLTEAIARGVPVIASRAGAIPGTVPPGAGLLIPPGDASELAAAIRRFATDEQTRESLTNKAHDARKHLPDWQTQAEAFATAVAELAMAGNAASAVGLQHASA